MRKLIASVGALAVVLGLVGPAASAPDPITRAEFSSSLLMLQQLASEGAFSGGGGQVSKLTCTTAAGSPDISCDDLFNPENEITIAVNPENANHLSAGSNDYWLAPKGATFVVRVPAGFFTSTNGGSTWLDGQVPMGSGGSGGNGDPVTAFNAKYDLLHVAQLSAGCGAFCGHISIAVATSSDGGLTYGSPVTVAEGTGSLTPSAQGVFNDKEWMTVDNNPSSPTFGRVYVTYTQFELSGLGYVRSPIMISWSDDGGKKWTTPKEISGSSADLCEFQETGPANQCDEDQFSVPVVLSDGTVVVHFVNAQNTSDWETGELFEGQILVVRSTDEGATWSAPIKVAALEDGTLDYPINVDGRAKQTGYQFRTQTVQGISVDPVNDDLYTFWTDNTNGTRDVVGSTAVTQTQVYISKSTDGGLTWSAPSQVTSGTTDKWMPWAAAHNGKVGIVYMEEGPDVGGKKTYVVNFRSSTDGGSTWSAADQLNAAPSQVNNSMWFRAGSRDPSCTTCATFIGDYNGLAAAPAGGGAVAFHAVWTDMSRIATFAPLALTGAPQDAYYAKRTVGP